MDLFSISMALTKGAIKQMAKEQIKSIAMDAVRKSIPRKIVEDQFVFYKSSRSVDSMLRNHENVGKAFINLSKMSKSQNYSSVDRMYRSFNSFGTRMEKFHANNLKEAIRQNRVYNFTDQDLDIFMRSQFNHSKGTFSINSLINDPQIYESCPLKYRIGEHDYFNIDRIIAQNIKDGKIDIAQLQKSSGKEYFKRIEERLDELRELKLIGDESNSFSVSKTYAEGTRQLRDLYNHMDYLIYKNIDKFGNLDNLKAGFTRPAQSFDFQERLDILKQKGYLSEANGNFSVSADFKKAHEDYRSFLKSNAERFLTHKYDCFEKMGLLNKSHDDVFEVTDLYHKSFREVSNAKNYVSSYFDDRLIQSISDNIPLSEVKTNFMSENFNEDYMSLRFEESLNSLSDKGIIKLDRENDSIELISHVNTKETGINFSFYDVNLYRNFKDNSLSIDDYSNLNAAEKKRISNHLHHGLIEIRDSALHITDHGVDIKTDFLQGVKISQSIDNFKLDKVTEYLASKGSFKIDEILNDDYLKSSFEYLKNREKPFEFGKYDANVILRDFMTPISKDEYIQKLSSAISEDKFDKESSIRLRRIEKLLENGYLRMDEDGMYHITQLGIESKKQMSQFSFTQYDTNVIFKMIEEHDGKLDVKNLKDHMQGLYKGKEVDEQFAYNLKRLNNNVDIGTLNFDGTSFTISEKGYKAAADLQRIQLQHVEKGLASKLEYLNYLGFVEEKDGVYNFTARYQQYINVNQFKVSNLDVSIYKKLTADNPFDIVKEKELLDSRYDPKNADRQHRVLQGRLDKLDQLGLVYNERGVYRATEKFHNVMRDHERFRHLDDPKDSKLKIQSEFKMQGVINNFTFNNVTDVLTDNDRLWTRDKHTLKLNDSALLERTEKHLDKLAQAGYALKTDTGYLIHDEIFERSQLLSLDKERRFTQKQVTFLTDLRDFQSLCQTQANKYIFENQNIGEYSLNELVKKGIIDFKIKNIDGNPERIYYLEKKGKKALIALTGDDRQAFDSKILTRPQEVKHDLYVYSAYKDFEDYLKSNNMRILDVKTDKDIRSLVNSGKLENTVAGSHKTAIKVEFADLYVEYENIDTLERGYANIEVDVGYTKDVIAAKADGIDNLMWYTDSVNQMTKIQSVQKTAIVKVISL